MIDKTRQNAHLELVEGPVGRESVVVAQLVSGFVKRLWMKSKSQERKGKRNLVTKDETSPVEISC